MRLKTSNANINKLVLATDSHDSVCHLFADSEDKIVELAVNQDNGKFRIVGTDGGPTQYFFECNASEKAVIINQSSEDLDFRVESENNTHCLFVDASADKVGINQSSPSYPLDVTGDINLTGDLRIGGAVQSFSGGGTVKVLTQKEDPTAAAYMGSWHNAASVQYGSLFYQILASDTEIIAFDPTSTHYPFFRLPKLSETDVGFKVICNNFLFNGTLYVYPHLDDSASGTKLIRGWSSTNNNTTNLKFDNVNASNSYRKLVFFLVEYDGDKYWLYQNVDTY